MPPEPFLIFPGLFQNWPADATQGRAILLCEQLTESTRFEQIQVVTKFTADTTIKMWVIPFGDVPDGIYRINCILFSRAEQPQPFYRIHPIENFDPLYFEITANQIRARVDPQVCEQRRNAIYDRMYVGVENANGNGTWRDVTFVCRDALISTACRLGPAEIRPLFSHGIEDLVSALTDAAIMLGFHELPKSVIDEQINRASDRRGPLFLLRFPRVRFDGGDAVLKLMPHVRRIFGILCLNRSSYATVMGGVYLSKKPGTSEYHYFNLNSYYRGNLATGSIANEVPDRWEREYRLLEHDAVASDLVFKLNAAHGETDLDTAYFRLWSILEAVAMASRQSKHLSQIRAVIEATYLPQKASDAVKVDFHGELFAMEQLIHLWHTWRNLTAHHGGIVAYQTAAVPRDRQESGLRRYLDAFGKHGVAFEYGEDYCLLELQDVARAVVRAYVDGRLAPSRQSP